MMEDKKKSNSVSDDAMKGIRRRFNNLEQEYSEWREHYIEIRDYMLPRHARSLESSSAENQNDGKKKHQKIIDSTAEDAIDILAAGMKSGMSSPSYPWFKLVIQDKKAMKSKAVKEWLYNIEELFRTIFLQSNIYGMLHHSYKEVAAFGTCAAVLKKDYEKVIVARAMTCGEYFLALNSKYEVDVFYRDFFMTAPQMVEEFGIDNVSAAVSRAFEEHNTETLFRIVHAVEPNDKRISIANTKKRKYRSIYYEYASDGSNEGNCLSASGFKVFNVCSARWNVVGSDVYGSSGGMKYLGDAKMLQKMNAKFLEAIDRVLKPPIQGTGDKKQVDQNPGGMNYVDGKLPGKDTGLAPLYQINPDLRAAAAEMEVVRKRIKDGFFNNLFTMFMENTGQKTAYEIAKIYQDRLTLLGPVLENVQVMLGQIISTTYEFCDEDGLIPPAPEEIQGQAIKIEYISIIAQAQKLIGLQGIERVSGFIGNIAGTKPAALDKLNEDEAIDAYADAVAVPPNIIRDQKEVNVMRVARNKMMQAQQAIEQAGQMAGAAKVMSETDTSRPSALTALGGRSL